MIFGMYCEVEVETLKQVKLKYVEDYESLVQFLTDFHLLSHKPSILAIDGLEYFFNTKSISLMSKMMRIHFILTLLQQAQSQLENHVFRQNNVVVSYKMENNEKLASFYTDCLQRFSSQIYYLARGNLPLNTEYDTWVLGERYVNEINIKTIEMF